MKRLKKGYRDFHGHEPRSRKNFRFDSPKGLVILGTAVAVEYATDKYNGGGDGKYAVYRHEFETPALVCMDEKARRQLYIIGNRIKVTEAGIEN